MSAAEVGYHAVGDAGGLAAVQRWFALRSAHIRRPPDPGQQTRGSPDGIVARPGGLLVPGVCRMARDEDGNSHEHQHGSDGPLHCALDLNVCFDLWCLVAFGLMFSTSGVYIYPSESWSRSSFLTRWFIFPANRIDLRVFARLETVGETLTSGRCDVWRDNIVSLFVTEPVCVDQ